MDFVKIRGKDIQDCFMQMKMKYGPEAHVYDQRVISEGGLFGTKFLAKKTYEIAIGIPEQQTSKDRVEKKLQDLKELLRQKTGAEPKKKNLGDMKPLARETDPGSGEEEDAPGKHFYISNNLQSRKDALHPLKDEVLNKPGNLDNLREFDSIHLYRLKERLCSEGMSQDYVFEIIHKAEKHLSFIEKSKNAVVIEKTAKILEERVSVDTDLLSGVGRGRRKIIFFVGPTGSGKTTTIAKLAAKYFLHQNRLVSLYSTDNYRIAAIEQLKRYADTMDIPFYTVKDIRKFKENLQRDGSELILIDTAGYSHKNPDFHAKMKAFSEAFGEKDDVENILVLSSTVSYNNAKSVMEAYENLDYKRLILTKLDETEYVGPFMELADIKNKAFTYFSTGQEVPFDIIPASKALLADVIVHPEKMKDIKGEVFSV
ncbi:MAG: flagellar biosynthesis protein FlhF [Leptospiraceae bacterium]|nr:flagellar biosynthesis protein FlhF [Leptospiraceae bacterium]MCP5499561.1 flagellar biosynthesis protein FlhF [Leptospiraceae bacterium]